MNGKKAKYLRQKARDMTEGMPDVDYHQYRHYKDTKKLKGNCTKAIHRKLKKGYKQAIN